MINVLKLTLNDLEPQQESLRCLFPHLQHMKQSLFQGTLCCDWISERGLKIVCFRFPSEKKHKHYNSESFLIELICTVFATIIDFRQDLIEAAIRCGKQ